MQFLTTYWQSTQQRSPARFVSLEQEARFLEQLSRHLDEGAPRLVVSASGLEIIARTVALAQQVDGGALADSRAGPSSTAAAACARSARCRRTALRIRAARAGSAAS